MENYIRVLEPRADPHDLYKMADIFIMNSKCENFARVVLEAMAMHLPVLGTSCGGTLDQVHITLDL